MELPSMGEMELVPMLLGPEKDVEASADITEALGTLSVADREIVRTQQLCPVADMKLGSMGKPVKVDVNGRSVFICCEGCRERLLAEPQKYLAKLPKEVVR